MEPLPPAELKSRTRSAELRASLAVNRELVVLYWQIGRDILDRQEREKWGAKVIDRLATDLKRSFPDMKGFSPRNLKYMRAFAEAWPEEPIVQAEEMSIGVLLSGAAGARRPPGVDSKALRFVFSTASR